MRDSQSSRGCASVQPELKLSMDFIASYASSGDTKVRGEIRSLFLALHKFSIYFVFRNQLIFNEDEIKGTGRIISGSL